MKEKYPWSPPPISPEAKLDKCQKWLWGYLAVVVKAIKEKYGEEGLSVIFNAAKEHYKKLTIADAKRLGIPTETGSLKDVVTLFDAADDILFTMKKKRVVSEVPTENTPERLLYSIQECNVAETIADICPYVCPVVSRAAEQGCAEVINPNIKIAGNRYLAFGDHACDIYIELKRLPQKEVVDYHRCEV